MRIALLSGAGAPHHPPPTPLSNGSVTGSSGGGGGLSAGAIAGIVIGCVAASLLLLALAAWLLGLMRTIPDKGGGNRGRYIVSWPATLHLNS